MSNKTGVPPFTFAIILIPTLIYWGVLAKRYYDDLPEGPRPDLPAVISSLAPQKTAGYIDQVVERHGVITISGWAIDARKGEAAKSIHVFVNGSKARQIDSTVWLQRPDVTEVLGLVGNPHMDRAGFKYLAVGHLTDGIRSFAEQYDGAFVELNPDLARYIDAGSINENERSTTIRP